MAAPEPRKEPRYEQPVSIGTQDVQYTKATSMSDSAESPGGSKTSVERSPVLTCNETAKSFSAPVTPETKPYDPSIVIEGSAGPREHGPLVKSASGGDLQATDAIQSLELTSSSLSAENAQALLPPSACVFVANLTQVRSDEELAQSVAEAFSRYGRVYVKIRRDARGMPFAFCQYENDAHASRAIAEGRRTLIDGRPCRTEPARANRSLYMSRLNGGKVTIADALEELRDFRPIESTWYPTQTDREVYRLPEGVWIKFEFYQACRDAQASFRDHPVYRLEQCDQHMRTSHNSQPMQPKSRFLAIAAAQSRYDSQIVDRKKIYIGNLPHTITEGTLMTIFGHYGNLVGDIHITKRSPSQNFAGSAFAFISYFHATSAADAVEHEDGNFIEGYKIKVQFRAGSNRRPINAVALWKNNQKIPYFRYAPRLPNTHAPIRGQVPFNLNAIPATFRFEPHHEMPTLNALGYFPQMTQWPAMGFRPNGQWTQQQQFSGFQGFNHMNHSMPNTQYLPLPPVGQFNQAMIPYSHAGVSEQQFLLPTVYRPLGAGPDSNSPPNHGDGNGST